MPQNWLLFNSVVDHCWANKFYVVYWFAINTQTRDLQRRVCFSWVIDSIAFGPVVDSMMVWWSLSLSLLLLLLMMMVNLNWTCHLYQHAHYKMVHQVCPLWFGWLTTGHPIFYNILLPQYWHMLVTIHLTHQLLWWICMSNQTKPSTKKI